MDEKKITVTITENGEKLGSLEDKTIFVVGENKSFTFVNCKAKDLFNFAVKIQMQFLENIIPPLLKACKPDVMSEMLFNEIAEIAKIGVQ